MKISHLTAYPFLHRDFKINDVDTNELRKSIRRQKLEKQGLSIAVQHQIQSAASGTGTGTGTSDDEDEGSTPSGDNADRSLASTLGGSSESIPQQSSSSFLQAVLDGPGSLSDRERCKNLPFRTYADWWTFASLLIRCFPIFHFHLVYSTSTQKRDRNAQQ